MVFKSFYMNGYVSSRRASDTLGLFAFAFLTLYRRSARGDALMDSGVLNLLRDQPSGREPLPAFWIQG